VVKVLRVQAPGAVHPSWLVLEDNYLPIAPILVFLKLLDGLGRFPRTNSNDSLHLKLFREFLHYEKLTWTDIAVARLVTVLLISNPIDYCILCNNELASQASCVRHSSVTLSLVLSAAKEQRRVWREGHRDASLRSA